MEFKKLHQQPGPLLICNVWDVPSAKAAEKLNFLAIGTSSSAIAGMLGYNDGEEISFSELEYIVQRITASTNLPLSVDLEAGYSREPSKIGDHIKRLSDLGVVGINFEDSTMDGERVLMKAEAFAITLSKVKSLLDRAEITMFINVRTDAFLLGHSNPLEETIKRIQLYQEAGADGIFVPFIEKEKDIRAVVACTHLPINVLSTVALPDFRTLEELGVKRISMGGSLFGKRNAVCEQLLSKVLDEGSFKSVFQ